MDHWEESKREVRLFGWRGAIAKCYLLLHMLLCTNIAVWLEVHTTPWIGACSEKNIGCQDCYAFILMASFSHFLPKERLAGIAADLLRDQKMMRNAPPRWLEAHLQTVASLGKQSRDCKTRTLLQVIKKEMEEGVDSRRVGLISTGPPARQHSKILNEDGEEVILSFHSILFSSLDPSAGYYCRWQ